MQLVLSKNNYVEKILRDAEGKLVRATFCIYENGGRIKARLVNVVYLDEISEIETKTFSLPGLAENITLSDEAIYEYCIVSPYFNLNTLYFSGSKPRAPSII